jgi:hypothetical protein
MQKYENLTKQKLKEFEEEFEYFFDTSSDKTKLKEIKEWISKNFIPKTKNNLDFEIVAGMYSVIQTQLSCIWNKISGKTTLADNNAKLLISKINILNDEILKRLG